MLSASSWPITALKSVVHWSSQDQVALLSQIIAGTFAAMLCTHCMCTACAVHTLHPVCCAHTACVLRVLCTHCMCCAHTTCTLSLNLAILVYQCQYLEQDHEKRLTNCVCVCVFRCPKPPYAGIVLNIRCQGQRTCGR